MKVAVCSDAHGARRNMDVFLQALPPVDAVCFLGDMDRDAEYLDWGLRELQPKAVFHAVAGNNDPFSRRAKGLLLHFDGVAVLVVHGHLYRGIRAERTALAHAAAERGCTLALYGHTHIQRDETLEGVRLINPGALMQGNWALLTVSQGRVQVEMKG